MTKLTFVCPCYNHENYVKDFLNGLMQQTCPDWELIIVDDASSDKTVEIIKSVRDSRIHLVQHKYNRGMAHGLTTGIKLAKTEVIAMVASDDIMYPEYVETILNTFEKYPEISACYTPLSYMNQFGQPMNFVTKLPIGKSSEKIFSDMFINENLLPSPGIAIKRSALAKYLPLDDGMIQYTDWQFNLLLLFKNKIHMLDKPVVHYRVSDTSACARSNAVIVREKIETKKLMDTVVDLIGNDKNAFMTYFGNNSIVNGQNIDARTIPYWLGRIALTSTNYEKQCWGLQTIMDFIADDKNVQLLNKLYGFSFKDYMGFAKNVVENNVENNNDSIRQKYKKYKRLTNILIVLCLIMMGVIVCL